MDTYAFDVLVIGAGIAGATAAAHLAADRRVALIEAEEAAGYHTTGRSAAMWIQNYGPPDVQVLTGLSRAVLRGAAAGLRRGSADDAAAPWCSLAPPEQEAALQAVLDERAWASARSPRSTRCARWCRRCGPATRVAAAIEDDAFDMDVAALHQGFLRQLRTAGGALALRSRTGRIERTRRALAGGGHRRRRVRAPPSWSTPPAPGATRWRARPGWRRSACSRSGAPASIIDPAPWQPRRLADGRRRRPYLVRAARGAHQADGLAGRRDRHARRTTSSRTSSTSPSPSTACSRRSISRCAGSSAAGPACAASPPDRSLGDRLGRATPTASSGASARAATASRPRPPPGRLVADLVAGRDPGRGRRHPRRHRSAPVRARACPLAARFRTPSSMSIHVALTHRTSYRYDRAGHARAADHPPAPGAACAHADPVLFAEHRAEAAFPELAAGPAGQFPGPRGVPRKGHAFRRHGRSRRRHGDDQSVRLLPRARGGDLAVRLRPGAGAGTGAVPQAGAGRGRCWPRCWPGSPAPRPAHHRHAGGAEPGGAKPRRLHRAAGAGRLDAGADARRRPRHRAAIPPGCWCSCCAISASPRASCPAT